jgi:hypothetical protein
MDLPTAIVVLLIAVAVIGWLVAARDGRALDAFGSGFIGYRSYGWPRGVQEEDQVHFTVAAIHAHPTAEDDRDGPMSQPEMIELADPSDAVRLERLR